VLNTASAYLVPAVTAILGIVMSFHASFVTFDSEPDLSSQFGAPQPAEYRPTVNDVAALFDPT
jgi:hypothetical protein